MILAIGKNEFFLWRLFDLFFKPIWELGSLLKITMLYYIFETTKASKKITKAKWVSHVNIFFFFDQTSPLCWCSRELVAALIPLNCCLYNWFFFFVPSLRVELFWSSQRTFLWRVSKLIEFSMHKLIRYLVCCGMFTIMGENCTSLVKFLPFSPFRWGGDEGFCPGISRSEIPHTY